MRDGQIIEQNVLDYGVNQVEDELDYPDSDKEGQDDQQAGCQRSLNVDQYIARKGALVRFRSGHDVLPYLLGRDVGSLCGFPRMRSTNRRLKRRRNGIGGAGATDTPPLRSGNRSSKQ